MAEIKTANSGAPRTTLQEQKPEVQKPTPQATEKPARDSFKELRIEDEKSEEKLGLWARFKGAFAHGAAGAENQVAATGGVIVLAGMGMMIYEAITIPGAAITALDPLNIVMLGLLFAGSALMLLADNIGRAVAKY